MRINLLQRSTATNWTLRRPTQSLNGSKLSRNSK